MFKGCETTEGTLNGQLSTPCGPEGHRGPHRPTQHLSPVGRRTLYVNVPESRLREQIGSTPQSTDELREHAVKAGSGQLTAHTVSETG